MPASLAELIGQTTGQELPLGLRQAKVVTVGSDTATIHFGDVTNTLAGVRMLAGAAVYDGDTVWVMRNGNTHIILGRLAAPYVDASPDRGDARLGISVPYGWNYISLDTTARSWKAAGNYVVLASDSSTFVNAPTGGGVYLRINNADRIAITTSQIDYKAGGAGSTHIMYSNGEFECGSVGIGGGNAYDNGLMIHNGWIRQKGANGLYWEDYGVGMTVGDDPGVATRRRQIVNWGGYGGAILEWYGDGVRWTRAPFVARSLNADVGFCVHHSGLRNASVWLGWTDGAWRIDGDGYTPVTYANVVPLSTKRFKRDIRPLERDRSKIKRLKPARFKRTKPQEEIDRWEQEVADGIWTDEAWNAKVRAQRDEEWIDFVAEDVAEVIPEAVTLDDEGKPLGLRHGPIIAYLVGLVQELDDRLEALERLPVVAMNKPSRASDPVALRAQGVEE